jgi:hypothetical protein
MVMAYRASRRGLTPPSVDSIAPSRRPASVSPEDRRVQIAAAKARITLDKLTIPSRQRACAAPPAIPSCGTAFHMQSRCIATLEEAFVEATRQPVHLRSARSRDWPTARLAKCTEQLANYRGSWPSSWEMANYRGTSH